MSQIDSAEAGAVAPTRTAAAMAILAIFFFICKVSCSRMFRSNESATRLYKENRTALRLLSARLKTPAAGLLLFLNLANGVALTATEGEE